MSRKAVEQHQRKSPAVSRQHKTVSNRFEAEVAEGLENIARGEIQNRLGRYVKNLAVHPSGVQFDYTGDLPHLLDLQTVVAVHFVLHLDIPRPRALLGHEHFHRLISVIDVILSLTGESEFKTFYMSAAGSESSVMMRLKGELAAHTGLDIGDDAGDLLIRIRRAQTGWDVLVRLSPRPLATRKWRVCDMQGALNGPVAHAMALLSQPDPGDVFVNLACGSGTLMIERLSCGKAYHVVGCDLNPSALDCAHKNIRTAGYDRQIDLVLTDFRQLPFANHFANVLCTDLPFGHLVGKHAENLHLYPLVLEEAARIAQPNACFVVITHEVHLMETILAQLRLWYPETIIPVSLRGLHPRIFLLRKF
jgi:23S rRNA G2445 N2-methylase RlmL